MGLFFLCLTLLSGPERSSRVTSMLLTVTCIIPSWGREGQGFVARYKWATE